MITLSKAQLDGLASIWPANDDDRIELSYDSVNGTTARVTSPATSWSPVRVREYIVNGREIELVSDSAVVAS